VGYPPFIKDIIDEAIAEDINLKTRNIRLMFAAEVFTEGFRDYLREKANIRNVYLDTLNVYGSADIGAMAWETGISILIKRLALKDPKLMVELFDKASRVPTLAQYNPHFINFEEINNELVLTGNSAIPLVRYSIGDHGGTYSFKQITDKLKKCGYDLKAEATKVGISDFIYQLPFVYVYERNDFSTTLYGLQIYPETIREALTDASISKYLTGKFTLQTKFNKKQDQCLIINLETKKGVDITPQISKQIFKIVFDVLCTKNSEFRELSKFLGRRSHPKLVFWDAEHPLYFKPGIKQKWIKK
jgi:phenylacetate-CoA ligase